ncbi:MAG TPA: acetate kinase [Actinomycetaceae bacterium]|nr:acetate kinase [Actinomycetaceae bacterium]
MTSSTVLVINSGSSSIKYQLLDPESGETLASGLVERIGESEGILTHKFGDTKVEESDPIPDHGAGLRRVIELCDEVGPNLASAGVIAVGHRVVQGGALFDRAVLIDDEVRKTIKDLIDLAPLHNPPNLRGIEVGQEVLPDIPHVAVFDTAFFRQLPDAAATYALNRATAEKYAIRRYGFHGTSHKYVSQRVSDILGRDDLRQIVLHLGNGASASAVVGGRAVDTSMGLTPLEGLVMGTRTGDIDAAAVFHLRRVAGMDVDTIDKLFNKESGLKGLAGENDMRAVRRMAEEGDANARNALDVYIHRLRKYIGSYTAVMNGLDAIAFTAGVGENDAKMRSEACAGLGYFGIELDEEANAARSGDEREISTPDSRVRVFVIPTNEELEIARQAVALLG